MDFDDIFNYTATFDNDCVVENIPVDPPKYPDGTELMQQIPNYTHDLQAYKELLNVQILYHNKKTLNLYTNYCQTDELNRQLELIPFILSEKAIFGQAHQPNLPVRNFLSPCQYFAFQSIFHFFKQILSCNSYADDARKWIINMFYSLLAQGKSAFRHSFVTSVRIKDKAYKDKLALNAIIRDNKISVYSGDILMVKGTVSFDGQSRHTIIPEKEGDSLPFVFLDSQGGKVHQDDAEYFIQHGSQIHHLIWACKSTRFNPPSLEALEAIGEIIVGLDAHFLHFFYCAQIQRQLFGYVMTIAYFLHREVFVIKTLVWGIVDEADSPYHLFGLPTPSVSYLISFTRTTSSQVMTTLVNQIIEFLDFMKKENPELDASALAEDVSFQEVLITKFWEFLLLNAFSFPKIIYDICYIIYTATVRSLADPSKNQYKGVIDLMFTHVIIVALRNPLFIKNDFHKKCLVYISDKTSLTFKMGIQDQISSIGLDPLVHFLEIITNNSYSNRVNIERPSVSEFTQAVKEMINSIILSSDALIAADQDKDMSFAVSSQLMSSSSSQSLPISPPKYANHRNSEDDKDDSSPHREALPIGKMKRNTRKASGNSGPQDDATTQLQLQKVRDFPLGIIPWNVRLIDDILYAYYQDLKSNQQPDHK